MTAKPMERVPEPELMDTPEQARAYAEADFEEPHSQFIVEFRNLFPGVEADGAVLDLGCGPADIAIRFARAFPGARVLGFDAGPNMLQLGREAVAAAGLASRVRLVQGHLPEDEPPGCPYDAIISNSLLHHLDDPLSLWEAVNRYGTAGTRVFIMDLCRPDSPDEVQQMVDKYAGDEPEILREDFGNSLRAAYRTDEVGVQLESAGLGYLRISEPTDRHLAVSGTLK